ncbi:MAG: hypothetical protein L0216_09910 [Planctomycetales bacterium]|nr:hypothetical protein [Planctomycetales bacterium]
MTPRDPVVGAPVRFVVRPPEGAAPPAEAWTWTLDRSREPGPPERRVLHAVGGVRAFQVLPERPIPIRVGIPSGLQGAPVAWFTVPVGSGGNAAPGAGIGGGSGTGHEHGDAGTLPMAAQHEAMVRTGEAWADLGAALAAEPVDLSRAADALRPVSETARLLPRFSLHKHEEALEEFRGLASDYERRLAALGRAVRSRDAGAARAGWRETDAWACLRCHVKFRFGVVKDLSRFPDLADPPPVPRDAAKEAGRK